MSPKPDTDTLIDESAVRAEVAAVCERVETKDQRAEILAILKRVNQEGRERARALLLKDRRGMRCAQRLSHLMDTIIRIVYDHAIQRVFKVDNPSSSERMAVSAVGGYGRGTLGPGSDVDLLFLLPYKQTPWGESVVEFVLYMLWDLGFKVGHATRRVDECVRLARSDMTIRTAVLEARWIWGDRPLFEELVARFRSEVVKGTGPEFIQAKLAERDERHRRQGASRYLVEPNVKEGKGGLRDLHTMFWITKYFYQASDTDELVKLGVFTAEDMRLFHKCEDFLWAVRCFLHFVTRRADDRVGFDVQRELASLLGYQEHPGLSPVERFMKHYFLVAKDVGDLTRIFCAALRRSTPRRSRCSTACSTRPSAAARRRSPATPSSSSTTTA